MTTFSGRRISEQAAEASIFQACKALRLPTMRDNFNELADSAAREQMSYRGFLAELLMAECDYRARKSSERRIKMAGFPRQKSLREFNFDANPNIDPAVINTLATSDWVRKHLPLCLIGDSGTGKSHLLVALGTEAAMAGFKVRYTLAAKLVNELVEAADEKMLTKTIARYGRVDLLCIDELGYMELDRHGAELLFEVLTEREESNSVAIASNEAFSGWTKTFTEPRLCAAIVDRLTYGGNIIKTGPTPTGSPRPKPRPPPRRPRQVDHRSSGLPRRRWIRLPQEQVKMARPTLRRGRWRTFSFPSHQVEPWRRGGLWLPSARHRRAQAGQTLRRGG